jgi:hypothetical protein
MPPGRRRAEQGQASAELVALLLLVAAVLGAAALAAGPAGARSALAASVRREVARAICLVGAAASGCAADHMPCVIATRRTATDAHVDLLVLRLGGGRAVLREVRSDGTVAVTLVDHLDGTLQDAAGTSAELWAGGRSFALGGEATAAAVVRAGRGRTWTFASAAAADAFLRDGGGRGPGVSPRDAVPAATYRELTFDVELGLQGKARGVGAEVRLGAGDTWGERRDADGSRMVYVRRDRRFTGALSIPKASARAGAEASEDYAVRLAADGTPAELVITTSGLLRAGVELPDVVRRVVGEPPATDPRRVVVETRLALDMPSRRALAAGFLAQVRARRPVLGAPVDVTAALRRELDDRGTVQVRAYADDESRWGAQARSGAGLRVGGGIARVVARSRLVDAASRGPDGAWVRRGDCLGRRAGRRAA